MREPDDRSRKTDGRSAGGASSGALRFLGVLGGLVLLGGALWLASDAGGPGSAPPAEQAVQLAEPSASQETETAAETAAETETAPETPVASLTGSAPVATVGPKAPRPEAEAPWRRFAVPTTPKIDARVQSESGGQGLLALVLAPARGAPAASLERVAKIDAPLTVILPAGGPAAHAARARGHEALLALPSGGLAGDPASDRAARAEGRLQSGLAPLENRRRLTDKIAETDGYVGLAVFGDARAAEDPRLLRTVFAEAREQGLMVLDGRASNEGAGYLLRRKIDGPSATVDVVLDAKSDSAAIERALALAEKIAKERGTCVAIARAEPETLSVIEAWIARRDDAEVVLSPITAVVRATRRPPPKPR